MPETPRLTHLACPSCAGQLDAPEDGLFRCAFCGLRSAFVDGVQTQVTVWRMATRTDAKKLEDHVTSTVVERGLPAPTFQKRTYDRPFVARSGRVAGRGHVERRGIFAIALAESDGDALLFLGSRDDLVGTDDAAPDGVPAALNHFAFRVAGALRREAPSKSSEPTLSWDDEVLVILIPTTEFGFTATLPARRFRYWDGARPDGRYTVAVNLWNGEYITDQAPRSTLTLWIPYGGLLLVVLGFFGGITIFSVAAMLVLALIPILVDLSF